VLCKKKVPECLSEEVEGTRDKRIRLRESGRKKPQASSPKAMPQSGRDSGFRIREEKSRKPQAARLGYVATGQRLQATG
jgi:hypothetical protein